jgi:tetratricopeptide (TPR) repeat protein
MIRALLVAACLAFLAATAQAGGADDLRAANEAAKKGQFEDAIRLFTQALGAGDLSPYDQFTAHKERGSEYVSSSLIADAFERLDQARSLREKAIADFSDAVKIKADDAPIYVARAQAYDLNGQHDAAIADFGAALKIKDSPVTLVQRANSKTAKGDYDSAVADINAALAAKDKDASVDPADIYNARGYTQFIGARYSAAADDFASALAAGEATRKGDVLWFPYHAAWLHIARTRAGENDADELARNAGKTDVKQWPGTLLAYFLGQTKIDDIVSASSHGGMGHARECGAAFFSAEDALAKKDSGIASQQLTRARAVCNIHTIYYVAAGVELKRLGK